YPYGDAEMFAIVSSFDAAYSAYAEFQAKMERYWGLRWLMQEGVERIGATVIKGDVLRLDGLPFVQRIPGLPELPRGQKVELDVLGTDLIDLLLESRLRDILSGQTADDVDEEEEVVDVTLAEPIEAEAGGDEAATDAAPPTAAPGAA
ncbi:MAG: RNB domain-containing ribonuclease, partial [Burkholderiaceae bacterium]